MSLEDRLAQPDSFPAAGRRTRHTHPAGWEPGIDTEQGVLTAVVDDETSWPDWSDVLENLGLDPGDWQVDGDNAEIRSWDQSPGRRCYYYKAKVSPRRDTVDLDLEELARKVRKRGPLRNAQQPPSPDGGGGFFCVVLTDWQAGKSTGGGAQQLVDRVARIGAEVEQRVTALRDRGLHVPNLAIINGGDLIESCDGHYPQQRWSVELDRRSQVKLCRRLHVELLDRWAPTFEQVIDVAVPGNHGENRRNGQSVTTDSDNADLEVVEQVADICAANPDRYGHIRFRLSDPDTLTVTVELDGVVVGVAHGHQARRGGSTVQQKILKWWDRMAATRHPVGDADVLVTGHYHHFEAFHDGTHDGRGRLWLGAPSLDGGSPYWEQGGGGFTSAGTLTFTAVDGRVDHIRVIPAD